MKPLLYSKLTMFLSLFYFAPVFGQSCKCDSVIQNRITRWPTWVENSDSIKLMEGFRIGVIGTEAKKQELLKIAIADTAWVAYPVSGKTVIVTLGKLDTLEGRRFVLNQGTPSENTVAFSTKQNLLKFLNERVGLNDEYFQLYFKIGSKTVVTPAFCIKSSCYLIDNIIFNLFIR